MTDQPSGTVTLFFSDIEGSTRLLRRLGTRRYAEVLERHRELVRAAFADHRGYEVNYEGDSFFVAFASAEHAIAAASQAQQAIASDRLPLGIRIGLHTGEPQLAPPKYVGLSVHVAARVMEAAHGGQVLLTQATRELLPASTAVRDLGEYDLKDLPAAVRLFQLEVEGLESEFPLPRTPHLRTNLPTPPTPLIGRERQLADIARLLADPDVRLVTLTGAGGCGKTRLAVQSASDHLASFEDGVYFVRLAPVKDGRVLVPTVARELGVRERPHEPLIDTLVEHLRSRELLLVLDNFEQIVEFASALATLLERAPFVKLVVTSRVRLRIGAEHVVHVSPLDVPPPDAAEQALDEFGASRLFLERARAANPEFSLDATSLSAVRDLCVRLDGLPLALELAATRMAVFSPAELASRLTGRFDVLGAAGPDRDERQRTLEATLSWSYDLLSEQPQRLFGSLAVFVDGWTLEAAQELSDTAVSMPAALEALLEANLVNRRTQADGNSRYWMFETIREYALERLRGEGREAAARERLFAYVCQLAARNANRDVSGGQVWLTQIEREQALYRVAMDWGLESGQVSRSLSLFLDIWWSWRFFAPAEIGRWALKLVERTVDLRTESRARLLYACIDIQMRRGSRNGLRELAEDALELVRELDDLDLTAWGLMYLAWSGGFEPSRTMNLMDAAVQAAQSVGGHTLLWMTANRFELALATDDRERASADVSTMLELAGETGLQTDIAMAGRSQAWLALRSGLHDEALELARHVQSQLDAGAPAGARAAASELLGFAYLVCNERGPAAEQLQAAVRLHRDSGFEPEVRWDLYALAATFANDDPERALVLRGAAGDLDWVIAELGWCRIETDVLNGYLAPVDAIEPERRHELEGIGRRFTVEEAVAYAMRSSAVVAGERAPTTRPGGLPRLVTS